MTLHEVKEKAKFYFEKKISVHIDTKDRFFYNGLIIELHETMLIVLDKVVGEISIAFSEIDVLDKYKPKEKVE